MGGKKKESKRVVSKKIAKIEKAIKEDNEVVKDESPTPELTRTEGNANVEAKIQELINLVNEESDDDVGTMFCLISDAKNHGLHLAMVGTGQDLSILVAASMTQNEQIEAVISHGGMMAAMKKAGDAGEEFAVGDMEKPTTEA